ncbi:MAG: hypothetical protein QG641_2402 [Candidatus Poribacteria bacterium]|nr:hypothetical protein [Candidatus Poribacteria bacterium]
MKEKINSYLKASKKGSDWLVSKQKDDGSITNVEVYYKATYVLGITGRIPEANKLINWIKTDVMKDNGDLNHNTYKNRWIAQDIHRLGRFDVSLPAIRYILITQAKCGGFCTTEDINQIVEPIYTARGGLCSIDIIGNKHKM